MIRGSSDGAGDETVTAVGKSSCEDESREKNQRSRVLDCMKLLQVAEKWLDRGSPAKAGVKQRRCRASNAGAGS